MDGSVFYIVGGALVLAALVLSAIGIRRKDSFPRSKREMAGILAVFGVIVAATSAYAVANAREEADHRDHELAEESAEAEENVADAEQAAPPADGQQAAKPPAGGSAGGATTLDVTSPDDGSTVFDPETLEADAGTVTLAYDNPSPVTHNIAIEDESGQTLAESEDIFQGLVELTAPLVPGEYSFYCSVPGHRESGMEGTLIVQ